MITGIITLTSKNQLSLPAAYVRKINLASTRRFTYRQRGEELILKPEASLQDALTEIRRQLPGKGLPSLTPEEVQQEIHNSYAHREI